MITFPKPVRHAPQVTATDLPSQVGLDVSVGETLRRSPSHLLVALDALEQGFAFFDRGGRVEHASAPFDRVLHEPTRFGLRQEIPRFVSALWGAANIRHLGTVVEPLEARSVHTGDGECRLHGTYVGLDLFGRGASVLVSVQVPRADPFSAERLHQRFGLTPKQSRVARLVAEGLRNEEIAQQLFLSAHTVRHHVEEIKLKVGGHTRAAVASRILQEAV